MPGPWLGAVHGQGGTSVSSFHQEGYALSFPVRALGFWMRLEQRKQGGKEIFSGPFLVTSGLQLWSVMGVEAGAECSYLALSFPFLSSEEKW